MSRKFNVGDLVIRIIKPNFTISVGDLIELRRSDEEGWYGKNLKTGSHTYCMDGFIVPVTNLHKILYLGESK